MKQRLADVRNVCLDLCIEAQDKFLLFVAKCVAFELRYPTAIVLILIASGLIFSAWLEFKWKLF